MNNEDYDGIQEIFQSVVKRLHGRNLAEIAELSGVCRKTLHSWVNGEVIIPSMGTLIPVGIVLGDFVEYGINSNGNETKWICL